MYLEKAWRKLQFYCSIVLLIAWHVFTVQKQLPTAVHAAQESKSDPTKFLLRTKYSHVWLENTLCISQNFYIHVHLQEFSSFTVWNQIWHQCTTMLKVVETVPLCRVGMDVFWNLTLQLTCAMNIYQGTFTSGIVSHTHYNYNAVSRCKMAIYHGKSAPCKRTYILRPDGVPLF